MIKGRLKSDVSSIKEKFKKTEVNIVNYIERALTKEAIFLSSYVKRQKLSDTLIRVRTGRLRRSITYKVAKKKKNHFEARIGTNVEYAKALEYGFKGSVLVGAHTRRIKQAFGKPLKNVVIANVRAHAVKRDMKARPFMRSSLKENASRIINNVRVGIRKEALK